MVALAFLMPIVASMGGNAGMQTLAVTIRTLATNELTKNNFMQTVSNKIINNIKGINRVVYDVTSKPPSTIELE